MYLKKILINYYVLTILIAVPLFAILYTIKTDYGPLFTIVAQIDIEDLTVWGDQGIKFVFPIIPCFLVLIFYREKQGLLSFEYIRVKKYKETIIKKIIFYSLLIGFICFLSYFILYLIGVLKKPISYNSNFGREMFIDLLGYNLYDHNRYLYYFLEGFCHYFIVGTVYAFFGISIALWTNKKYLVILIPTLFFILFTVFIEFLPWFELKYYFSPMFIMMSSAGNQMSTFKLLYAFIIPISTSILLIYLRLRRNHELIAL